MTTDHAPGAEHEAQHSKGQPASGVAVVLPLFDAEGRVSGSEARELNAPGPWTTPARPIESRIAFAAAHVVPQVGAENVPGAPAVVDWDATLAYRHRIWEHGLGVADAMDTAQRGMGLDWAATQELVRRSAAEAASVNARVACGAGTDQLDPEVVAALEPGDAGLTAVTDAYREQVNVVQDAGAQVIVMASRALAQVARGPEDYARVYDAVLAEADQPVVLHWLGTMFDPALAGYWGSGLGGRRDGDVPRPDPRAPAPDRRRQGVAARRRPRGRPAPVAGGAAAVGRRGAAAAVHRRRLQLPRAHRGRRAGPLRRAARHLRGDLPGRLHGPAGVRRRATPTGRAQDPGLDRGAGPAHLRGAHVLLQDRHRVPVLAERVPARVLAGGRAALRPVAARTSSSWRAWPTAAVCCSTRPWPPRGCGRS